MSDRHIEGSDRRQTTLLPDTLDEYVDENNPVRFIEAFVDSIDLKKITTLPIFSSSMFTAISIRSAPAESWKENATGT